MVIHQYVSPKELVAKYVDANSNVTWPTDPLERTLLARAIFGQWLIGRSLDAWIGLAIDKLENPEPAEPYARQTTMIAREDRWFRTGLAGLSGGQKMVVRQLVMRTAVGVVFNDMVVLDQCRYGDYILQLRLKGFTEKDQAILLAPLDCEDLHDEVFDWIWSFSKYADELVERRETQYGIQIGFRPLA